MNVQSISVALIDPPLFNSRLSDNAGTADELRALGNSIKQRQLEPICVIARADTGRYRLVFGSRRLEASKLVGLTDIDADVLQSATDAGEVLANGVENVQRRDLTTFEQARLCAKLRELKMSGKEVSAQLGLSVQHVSNLAICYEHLPQAIKDAWQKGEPGTDMNFLRSIITTEVDGKKSQASEAQMTTAYQERVQALTAVDGDEEEEEEEEDEETPASEERGGAPIPAQKFTVYKLRYKQLLKALHAVRASQMCIDSVRYLVGDIGKIRGVNIEPPTPKKIEKPETVKVETKKKGK